ncbi:hypothetical protein SUGI_1075520 [Cryptomeria japonica]|uniref:kinetochore protein NDC80 homolog n=1 Tax=Cryptomeria japonica TaxID=3369 RepID=UPI002414864E|nr:kinetochore protein NDC80 homolog [Cryptomeria japonica]GLJ50474.1 hypothetical protein SUGI_1075520 [Cryptomeria japonica]
MKKRQQSFLSSAHDGNSSNISNLSSAAKQMRRTSSAECSNPFNNMINSSNRRSSIAYTKNPKQDPRNVNSRSFQLAAVGSLNAYFQSHGFAITIPTKGLPTGKEVKEIIHFLVHQLDPEWPLSKLEEDIPFLFKQYGYPFQINKSALYAAGSPHSWPPLLAALAWLVQLLRYNEKVEEEERSSYNDETFDFLAESYSHFLKGDDTAVEALDNEFMLQLEEERAFIVQNSAAVEMVVKELEAKVQSLKTGPSVVEALENDKSLLAKDVVKFHSIINNFSAKKEALEKSLVEKKQELDTKNMEIEKLSKENEVLKQQVDAQHVNVRDYEKMSRELHNIEEDIRTAESARSQWDEKAWELEVLASKKLKEIEGLVDRYHQEITRLKLGTAFEYKLNSRGVTATDILGVDFKATIKAGIISCTEDFERNSREKWEESIAIQQQLHDKVLEQEGKKKINASLVAKSKKLEARFNAITKSMEEYVASKMEECEKLSREVEKSEQDMKLKDIEADEYLKKAISELEERTRHYDEEIKRCSNELLRLIDMVAKHKEHVESAISNVKKASIETLQECNSIYGRKGKLNGKRIV